MLRGLAQQTPERGLTQAQPGTPPSPTPSPTGRLPVQGREEAAGGQQDGALGEAAARLAHPLQVPLGEVGHADGPCRAVQELVPVSGGETRNQKDPQNPPPLRGFDQLKRNPGASAGQGLGWQLSQAGEGEGTPQSPEAHVGPGPR